MNLKAKILTILLFTLFVIAGGGYYFYTLIKPTATKETVWYEVFTQEQQDIAIVPDYFENLPKKSSKANRAKSHVSAPEALFERMDGVFSEPNLAENNFNKRQVAGSAYTNKSYSYRQDNQDSRVHSTLSGGLAYSNNTTRRSSVSDATHSSSYGTSVSSPLAVPFSGRIGTENTTSDGTILFDPSATTTEEIEKHAIPVGEGWWIMLMMVGAYAIFRRMNK